MGKSTVAAELLLIMPLNVGLDQGHDVVLYGGPVHALLLPVDADRAPKQILAVHDVLANKDNAQIITPWYRVLLIVPMELIMLGVAGDVPQRVLQGGIPHRVL